VASVRELTPQSSKPPSFLGQDRFWRGHVARSQVGRVAGGIGVAIPSPPREQLLPPRRVHRKPPEPRAVTSRPPRGGRGGRGRPAPTHAFRTMPARTIQPSLRRLQPAPHCCRLLLSFIGTRLAANLLPLEAKVLLKTRRVGRDAPPADRPRSSSFIVISLGEPVGRKIFDLQAQVAVSRSEVAVGPRAVSRISSAEFGTRILAGARPGTKTLPRRWTRFREVRPTTEAAYVNSTPTGPLRTPRSSLYPSRSEYVVIRRFSAARAAGRSVRPEPASIRKADDGRIVKLYHAIPGITPLGRACWSPSADKESHRAGGAARVRGIERVKTGESPTR